MSSLRPVSGTPAEVTALLHDWLGGDDPEPLVVQTSGSTGEPKRVLLSRRALVASADATHRRLGGVGQWLLALPAPYVAGLQVLVRSLVGGHGPVPLGEYDALPDAVAAMSGPRRYVSFVPTQLHRHLASGDAAVIEALGSLDAILLGGGPLDPALRDAAETAGLRVVATYGMSETAGGCVYDGQPLDGVTVDTGADGRIRIAGPTLFDGYQDDPRLTAGVLRDGWFLTSDTGRVDLDGRLRVLGRIDDVVISGGVNVPTAAVALRLRAHPRVEAAEVVGVPDEQWGQRIVAFTVGDLSLAEGRDWVAVEHPRSWAPRELRPVLALPLLDNGKVDRLALVELGEGR